MTAAKPLARYSGIERRARERLPNRPSYTIQWDTTTCARGLLEASAIATWLLDPQIDASERVRRSLAMRYETLMAQRKLANADGSTQLVQQIDGRIESVAGIAAQLDYPPLNDKNGRRIGIGSRRPSMTDLSEQQFDLKNVYRILSGVAHCDVVTASQVGFNTVEPSSGGGVVKRLAVDQNAQRLLLAKGTELYSHAVWFQMVQFGCDLCAAAEILETPLRMRRSVLMTAMTFASGDSSDGRGASLSASAAYGAARRG